MILWSLPMTKVVRSIKSWSIATPRTSVRASLYGGQRQIVGGGDLVTSRRRLPETFRRNNCGSAENGIEPLDAVGRYANDGGAGGIKFIFLLREGMRFEIAALGEGGGIEIDHDRAFFQRVLQRKIEFFSGQ